MYKHYVLVWWALDITNREMSWCAWEFPGQGSFQVEWSACSGFWWLDQGCSWWEWVSMCCTWFLCQLSKSFIKAETVKCKPQCNILLIFKVEVLHGVGSLFVLKWNGDLFFTEMAIMLSIETSLSWLLRGLFGCGGDDEPLLLITDFLIFDSSW